MWGRIKSPVYTILFAFAIVIADFVLGRFLGIALYYGPFHVWYAAPVLFVGGVIWLILRLVSKPKTG